MLLFHWYNFFPLFSVNQWQRCILFVVLFSLATAVFAESSSGHVTSEVVLPKLIGLRIENPEDMAPNRDEMIPRVRPDVNIFVSMFGLNMDKVAAVLFSPRPDCDQMPWMTPIERFEQQLDDVMTVRVKFPVPSVDELYYVCLLPRLFKQTEGVDPSNETFNFTTTTAKEAINSSKIELTSLLNGPSQENPTTTPLPIKPAIEYVSKRNVEHPEALPYLFQGSENHQIFIVTEFEDDIEMPLWIQIVIIAGLLVLSGLFSGLNLGLMSLDQTELKIFMNSGSRTEKNYAKKIYPLRKTGNYLLCSILFANVIVNSAISILFDDLLPGIGALCLSSLGIVLFGEIFPQSMCSRYGLAIGARTIWITKFFMLLTAPLSWPTSKILDKLLGKEVGHYYNRERLLELIRLSTDLQKELKSCQEVAIVTGALELGNKAVKDVLVPLRDTFMLPSDAILDTKTIGLICKAGYTRIPVYEGSRDNVCMILNVKDLALLNPEDKIPLKTVCRFYRRQVSFVPDSTPLNYMLNEFKKGNYHMAFVTRNQKGKGTEGAKQELIGLLTLEDVIEEIIQSDIMDETDVKHQEQGNNSNSFLNASKRLRSTAQDMSVLLDEDSDRDHISPQLAVAAYQFLSTSFEPMQSKYVSEKVLQYLIKTNIFVTKRPEASEAAKYLFERNVATDNFVLILEGRVEVVSGIDDMTFEAGPFFSFGRQFLKTLVLAASRNNQVQVDDSLMKFTPDYSVRIVKDLVYFELNAPTMLAALKASNIERLHGSSLAIQSLPQASNHHKLQLPELGKRKGRGHSLAISTTPSSRLHSFDETKTSKTSISRASETSGDQDCIAAGRKPSRSPLPRPDSVRHSISEPGTNEPLLGPPVLVDSRSQLHGSRYRRQDSGLNSPEIDLLEEIS